MSLLPLELMRSLGVLFVAHSLVTTLAVAVNLKDKNKLG